uniref:Metal dependent phosphohydrolase n=1 Tax=Rhodopseudomonas palustris (strain BisA53) TaxID=316055 RepID=Q07QP7_RHOP5
MSVQIVADSIVKLADLRMLLPPGLAEATVLLGRPVATPGATYDILVAADLRVVTSIAAVKAISDKIKAAQRRIFLIDEVTHLSVAQAHALGATHVLAYPAGRNKLLPLLIDRSATPALTAAVAAAKAAAQGGAEAFKSMFTAVLQGEAIDVSRIERAGQEIATNVACNGLSNWLDTVRRYHEGTYQHCLLVAGVVTGFGLKLGVSSADLRRLYMAAMFHDIGKATIPVAILDKPGALDPKERTVMQAHSANGFDLLKDNSDVDAEVRDAVRHHHEYLDGSGYPDGLSGSRISDLVRILTIADIFAALIEDRHYKPSMPRSRAFDIVSGMDGKLEKALVEAFRDVAVGN